jgi:hypothetical protein
MQESKSLYQSPIIFFDCDDAVAECLTWCLRQYGSTDWHFVHIKDLFGNHECIFKFLSVEDLAQFLLAWHNTK